MDGVTLINPNLVVLKKDPMTTGIVWLPISLAYYAAVLKKQNIDFTLIDSFGESVNQAREFDKYIFRGLKPEEIIQRIPEKNKLIVVYALNVMMHESVLEIVKSIKEKMPHHTIAILENTQSVLGYSLDVVRDQFFEAGADVLLMGEPEVNALEFTKRFLSGRYWEDEQDLPGVLWRNKSIDSFERPKNYQDADALDALPYPLWDIFPLRNYWELGYGHGVFQKPYLPILTSRGCWYKCEFCVSPLLNSATWRPRSARGVVDEIEYFNRTLGVTEFHIEDLNPSLNEDRIRDMASEIMRRKLKIKWQISAGAKIEYFKKEDTLELMSQSGFWWVGFCPESGSKKIRKLIRKKFDDNQVLGMIPKMRSLGIYTQSCFILGFPGETDDDRLESLKLMINMVKKGLDEIAVFIVTPIPGTPLYGHINGFQSVSELNFSPVWRDDFEKLNKFRLKMYGMFLFYKYLLRPYLIPVQAVRLLRRKFSLRMEMTAFRGFSTIMSRLVRLSK